MKKKILFIILLILVPRILPGAEKYPPLLLPEGQTYDIAFSELKNKDLNEEDEYLTFSIPLLLKEELELITNHYFTTLQQESLKRKILVEEIKKIKNSLKATQKEKDDLVFSAKAEGEIKQGLKTKNKKIEENLKYINYLDNNENITIDIPESIPVKIAPGSEEGQLFPVINFSLVQFTQKKNIELIIYGSLERVQNYIFLEIKIFDALAEKDIFTYKNAAESQDLYNTIKKDIFKGLAIHIVGREWTSLVVQTDFPDARIFVNSDFAGYGGLKRRYIKPEPLKIRVSYPGFYDEEKEVTPEPFEVTKVIFELQEVVFEKLMIKAEPVDTNIYANSVWVGTLPLDLDLKPEYTELLLVKEGYEDYKITLSDLKGTAPASLKLSPVGEDKFKIQEKKRDHFYLVLGIWLLFLPVPEFLDAYQQDYEKAGFSDDPRMLRTASGLQVGYWSSLVVSVGLFTFSVVQFWDYLNYTKQKL